MTPEPQKRFSRVSDCCKAPAMVSCGDEGTCCHICTACKNPCDVIADKGLNTEPQPSAPSMSIEEAKNLLKTFYFIWKKYHNRKDLTLNYHSEAVDGLIKASALIAASEQREKDAEEIDNLFGWVVTPFMKQKPITPYEIYLWEKLNEVRNKARKQILNQDSQQNISSKKSECQS